MKKKKDMFDDPVDTMYIQGQQVAIFENGQVDYYECDVCGEPTWHETDSDENFMIHRKCRRCGTVTHEQWRRR